MGHLNYTELGNPGYNNVDSSTGNCHNNPDWDDNLLNTGDFQNLLLHSKETYWSGTEYPTLHDAWRFRFDYGNQDYGDQHNPSYGLALRSGQVVNSAIPTLSEWGQILLVVMLGINALWLTRRRRVTSM